MSDVIPLGIVVESDSVGVATERLEALASKGERVEAALGKIEAAAARTGKTLTSLGQGNADPTAGIAAKVAPATAALNSFSDAQNRAAQAGSAIPAALNGISAGFTTVSASATAAKKAMEDALKPPAGATAAASTKPIIDGLDKVGISAKQTAAALRGVPAQFTDIVTSLQGGQSPLTVLLQQGGQLKDMFGGIGPAARALGGYVAGLINPFTLAAAAAAGLALAYNSGAKEAENYNKALILSGNAAGTTVSQLQSAAQAISAVRGTQSGAAQALAEVAQSGAVGAKNLQAFTAAAIDFERATGTAVSKTAQQFKALADDPLKAVLKLNEGMNFLTVDIYKQIAALTEQGKKTEAAALAQTTFADTLQSRSGQILGNIGLIEQGWNKVKGAVLGAASAIAGIGRVNTPGDQLANVQLRIQQFEQSQAALKSRATGAGAAERIDAAGAGRLQQLQAEAAALQGTLEQGKQIAAADAQRFANVKNLADFQKRQSEFETKDDKRKREVGEQTIKNQDLLKQGLIDEKEARKLIADINEKYKDKSAGNKSGRAGIGENEVASIKAGTEAQQQYLKSLQDTGVESKKLTEGQRLVLKIQAELETSVKGAARAQKEKALAAAQDRAAVDLQVVAAEHLKKVNAENEAEYQKSVAAISENSDKIIEQARAQEAANAVFGKGRIAVEEMTLAQEKRRLATLKDIGLAGPTTEALEKEIAARERLIEASRQGETKQLLQQQTELNRASADALSIAQLEGTLVGVSATDRARIVESRRAELELAKRIAEIDRSSATPEGKDEAKAAARIKSATDEQTAVLKVQQAEYQKSVDQYDDIFRKGFAGLVNGGKGTWKAFTQSLATTFKTTVADQIYKSFAQPFVVKIVASLLGLTGAAGTAATAANAASTGGSALGLANNASSAYSAYTNIGTYADYAGAAYNTAGAALGFGPAAASTIANNTALAVSLGIEQGSAAAAASAAGAASTSAAGGAGAATAGSAGSAVLAAAPYVAVALVALNALGVFRTKTVSDTGFTGQLGRDANQDVQAYTEIRKGGTLFDGPSYSRGAPTALATDQAKAINTATQSVFQGTEAYAKALGYSADTIAGYTQAIDISTKDRTPEQIQAALGDQFGALANNLANRITPGIATYAKEAEASGTTLARLGTSLVQVNAIMDSLGDAALATSLAGGDAASKLIDLAGGIDGLAAKTNSFKQNFYTEQERADITTRQLTETFAKFGATVPASREAFRDLVEAQDLTTDAGRRAYVSLLNVADAFASVTEVVDSTALRDAFRGAFYSQAEQFQAAFADLAGQFGDLGLNLPKSGQDFRALVDGIDTSTAAGKKLKQQLLELSPEVAAVENGFYELTGTIRKLSSGELANARKSLEDQIFQLANAGNTGALRARAAQTLNAQDPTGGLAALQAQIDSLNDAASRAAERLGLQNKLDQALGNTAALRERELAALDASNRPLQQRLYALEDVNSALAGLQKSVDAEKTAIQQRLTLESEARQVQITSAREAADSIRGIANALASAVKQAEADSEAADFARLQRARGTIESARGVTDLASVPGLEDALGVATADNKRFYATFEEYAFQQGVTASTIASLDENAQKQLRTANDVVDSLTAQDKLAKVLADAEIAALDAQLAKAQEQVDAIFGVDSSVKSVQAALATLAASIAAQAAATQAAAIAATVKSTAGTAAGGGGGSTYVPGDPNTPNGTSLRSYTDAELRALGLDPADVAASAEWARKNGAAGVRTPGDYIDQLISSKLGAFGGLTPEANAELQAKYLAIQLARVTDFNAGNGYVAPATSYTGTGGSVNSGQQTYNIPEIANAIAGTLAAGATVAQIIAAGQANYGLSEDDIRAAARAAGIPGFAKGTNYLPRDMLIEAHAGERIIPAADNAMLISMLRSGGADNSEVVAELKQLRERLDSITTNTGKTSEVLVYATAGGTGPMIVEVTNPTP